MKVIYYLIVLTAVLLSACGGQTALQQAGGDTVAFRYARRLQVVRYDNYTVAMLANPWKPGKTLHTYVLVPRSANLPDDLPEGTIVRTPLCRSVMFTTVHCALLTMLHCEQAISGVADLKYIKIPYIQEGCRTGRIVDCGDGMNPLVEKIIDLHPDALFLSPFENSGGYGKVEEIDIPIIECAEYMEETPLGRAEWMRFYGMLFGVEHEADSLFAVVDSSYSVLRQMARRQQSRSVVVDKMTGAVWYVPGGRSTIGRMLQDAGASYAWSADEHSGSVSLPFEAVLERAGDADVWLFRYSANHPSTLSELLAEHHGYSQFRSFREGEAYGCNVEMSQFYEQSPFRPDYLLADFIQILHPDIRNLPPLRYYHKVTHRNE